MCSRLNWLGAKIVCPDGWHVPSHAEWMQLNDYCGSQAEWVCDGQDVEHIAKALASDTLWRANTRVCAIGNDLTANNSSGFSAMPSGCFTGNGIYRRGDIAAYLSTNRPDGTRTGR